MEEFALIIREVFPAEDALLHHLINTVGNKTFTLKTCHSDSRDLASMINAIVSLIHLLLSIMASLAYEF